MITTMTQQHISSRLLYLSHYSGGNDAKVHYHSVMVIVVVFREYEKRQISS